MASHFPDIRSNPLPSLGPLDDPSKEKLNAEFQNSEFFFFYKYVWPIIPQLSLLVAACYDIRYGRPSVNLNILTALYIIKEMKDWTVAQALHAIRFDRSVQLAVGSGNNPSDDLVWFCEKTFYTFQKNFQSVDGPKKAFELITLGIAEKFGLKHRIVRIDSTLVQSNIKTLNRGGLVKETLCNFFRYYTKDHPESAGELDLKLRKRYDKSLQIGYDPFNQAKPEVKLLMLGRMAEDAVALVDQFRFDPRVYHAPEFQILRRLVREQFEVTVGEEGGKPSVKVKVREDVASDSLQSPYDTGVTYSGAKKLKGRKLHIGECNTATRKDRLERPALNLAIYIKTEGAHTSDAHGIEPFLEALAKMNIHPEVILVDQGYNTAQNRALAAERGIELVSTVHGGLKDPAGLNMPGGEPRLTLADFSTDEAGAVTGCPQGQTASSAMSRNGDACNVHFDKAVCGACPSKGRCPVRIGTRSASMRYALASLEVARNRAWNATPAIRALARQRNGAEATMSESKRVEGTRRLRVRGDMAVAAANFLKGLGLNIRRAWHYWRAIGKSPLPNMVT
jgi:hypothetical protein